MNDLSDYTMVDYIWHWVCLLAGMVSDDCNTALISDEINETNMIITTIIMFLFVPNLYALVAFPDCTLLRRHAVVIMKT